MAMGQRFRGLLRSELQQSSPVETLSICGVSSLYGSAVYSSPSMHFYHMLKVIICNTAAECKLHIKNGTGDVPYVLVRGCLRTHTFPHQKKALCIKALHLEIWSG
jgi:hypothetical protein